MDLLVRFKKFIKIQSQFLAQLLKGGRLVYPHHSSNTLDADDVEVARKWLKQPDQWYDGELVRKYQEKFATWNGSKYAYAFMSGRVALSAAIEALKLQKGDEVLVPGYTCVVVANAFKFAGIKIVYADIELDTFGPDINSVQQRITGNTKALLIHHLYGLVCRDYEALVEFARKHNLKIIEDCAHATGAEFRGKKVGTYADVAFYSSEQSKIFNTIQGGIAVTDDDEIARGLESYYNRAAYPEKDWIDKQLYTLILNYYQFKHPRRWIVGSIANLLYGNKRIESTSKEEEKSIKPSNYGCKMPGAIAAIALNQLNKVDEYNERRRNGVARWNKWCDRKGYKRPSVINQSLPVWLRYPVLVEPGKKQDTSWALKQEGVQLGVWFVSHLHPANRYLDSCPNADIAVKQCVNFPTIGI